MVGIGGDETRHGKKWLRKFAALFIFILNYFINFIISTQTHYLMCARKQVKRMTWITYFNPHKNPMNYVLLLISILSMRKSMLVKVQQTIAESCILVYTAIIAFSYDSSIIIIVIYIDLYMLEKTT